MDKPTKQFIAQAAAERAVLLQLPGILAQLPSLLMQRAREAVEARAASEADISMQEAQRFANLAITQWKQKALK